MITTDDGSYADKGFVTDKLRQLIENGTRIDLVVAVGPIVMMRAVAEMTRKENIHTVVSLNPIMIDGTGMCGGCRVLIDGKSEFACVDGPEFDAHRVDFAVLVQRNSMYRDAEQRSMAEFEHVRRRKLRTTTSNAPVPSPRVIGREIIGKESNDEHDHEEVSKPRAHKGADQDSAPADARAARRGTCPQLRRSESRLQPRTRSAGSRALPGMRQAHLHRQLPCRREGEGIRRADCRRRLPWRRRKDSRRQCPARHHRARLPAGRSLRRQVPAVEKGEAARHRLSRTLRGRL